MIKQQMLDFIADHVRVPVHCREGTDESTQLLYALALANKMYHVEINFTIYKHPKVFAINEKQLAAMVDNEENLALAVATACALTYGWVDPVE